MSTPSAICSSHIRPAREVTPNGSVESDWPDAAQFIV